MLKKKFLAVCTAGTLAFGVAAAPAAQAQQNGLVNVDVGNVNIARDVNVAVAAAVVATVCGVQIPVSVIARAAANNATVCTAPEINQPVTVTR
jgi:uncharacterized protein HemY